MKIITIFIINISFLILLSFFFQCKSAKTTTKENSADIQTEKTKQSESSIPKIIIDNSFDGKDIGFPFKIDSMYLEKDIISISVRYSGGCNEHYFKLYTNKQYSEDSPKKLQIFLTHDNNGDFCKALIFKTLKFDVSETKYKKTGSIILFTVEPYNSTEYRY